MATILIVEDDLQVQDVYARSLRARGYAVVTTNNGNDAMTIVQSEKPDLIILDMLVSGVGGLQFLKWLRTVSALANVKVIVTSNLESPNIAAKVKKLGVSDYLLKVNLSLDKLEAKVKELLETGPGK